MKEVIEAAFPVCTENECVTQSTEHPIHIFDQKDGKCISVDDTDSFHFTIQNSESKLITLIAIDKCIWDNGSGHKKCDFAVTDSSTFLFVEIKDTENRKSIHRNKAKSQLEETIKRFYDEMDLSPLNRVAIICWQYIPIRPAAKTQMQSAEVHFWDNYKVELLEGNSYSF